MKPIVCICLCLICLFACAQPATKHELVFTSVNVIPMDREIVLENRNVVITNGVIKSISDVGTKTWGRNAKVIDGKGKYLMPGLAEMHAHVPPIDDMEPMKNVLLLFLANGVTTIRGMLGHPRHLELREKIKSGEILGPSFYTSGPSANGNSASTPEAAVKLVNEQKAAGYDFIKIHPGIKLASFEALAKEAKKLDIPFAGHVPSDVGIWNALNLGILTIDHLDGFIEALMPGKERFSEGAHGLFAMYEAGNADSSYIPKLMRELIKHKVWVVPTQALAVRWQSPEKTALQRSEEPEMKYMDAGTVANWVKTKEAMEKDDKYNGEDLKKYIMLRNQLIKACQQYKVPLLLGSDAPQVFNVPGFSAHHELQYMVDAGLTPYEALYTATVNVGRFYRQNQGTVTAGATADLILINGNPLEDISHVKNIGGVILRGRWFDGQWLDEALSRLAMSK